jgi:hypothetical protein
VPIYYLRLIDPRTNGLRYRYLIDAADDTAAIEKAEDKRSLAPMELTCDGRVVRRWDGFPEQR